MEIASMWMWAAGGAAVALVVGPALRPNPRRRALAVARTTGELTPIVELIEGKKTQLIGYLQARGSPEADASGRYQHHTPQAPQPTTPQAPRATRPTTTNLTPHPANRSHTQHPIGHYPAPRHAS